MMKLQTSNFKPQNKSQLPVSNNIWILRIGFGICFGFWILLFGFGVGAEGRQVFVGVFREGAPRNMNYVQQFAQQAGRQPAMIMWYQDWAQVFPLEDVKKVGDYGAVPHIVWEPWYWNNHQEVQVKDIIAGKWDGYIESWAKAIKAYGRPIFLRVGHEFNIDGYPWGLVNNDKNPETYIKAFRHVVDVFRRNGTTNAKWVWAPMNYSFPAEAWNDWTKAYPGDSYVDWIGFDGYNWGTTQSWSDWQAFKYLFRDQVRLARKLWPKKPIMVAEFASAEKGGDKAAWLKELPSYLKTSMRDIEAIVWFDLKKETDWRIDSSEKSLAAFRQIMQDPIFSSSGEALANFSVRSERAVKLTANALKAPQAVKIDGQLTDWDKSRPIVMKEASFFKEGLNWGGSQDLSGNIYLMWDETNLYLAAEVTDKISLVNKKERQDIWNGDAIEMVFGLNPSANPNRESFEKGDYQLGFGTGDGGNIPAGIWNWQRRRSPAGSEIVVKRIDKPQGYILEAKVPWSFFLNSAVPTAGTKLGFDVAIDDADITREREKQFIWNGDFNFYKDPSVWGILEFK